MEAATLDEPMARKKPEPKPVIIGIKASGPWRDWLQEVAEHCRTDVAKLLDAAVAEYAAKRGFTVKPPKR